jgi:hypothetical protein
MRNVLSSLVLLGAVMLYSTGTAQADTQATHLRGTRVAPARVVPPRASEPHRAHWERWQQRKGALVSVPELGRTHGGEALALLLGATLIVADRRRRTQIA